MSGSGDRPGSGDLPRDAPDSGQDVPRQPSADADLAGSQRAEPMSREAYAESMREKPSADAGEDAGDRSEPADGYDTRREDPAGRAQGMTRGEYADQVRQRQDSPGDPGGEGQGTWEPGSGNPDAGDGGHAPGGQPGDQEPALDQNASWPGDSASALPDQRPDALRDAPRDPVTGNPLEARDAEFLGYHPRQLEWFRNGDAPLGMTPEVYRDWSDSLRDALRADGIPPEDVDVRLLGSAARGFSGPHKRLPSDDEITASQPPEVAEAALQGKAAWLGDDPDRLRGRPFDAMSRLGLDEPSDYDTNISSDIMTSRAREQWEAAEKPGSFLNGDHEYVNKETARQAFPNVTAWARNWSDHLGRDVSWAVFPGTGPKDVSASGHYVHFQDDDWIVFRPEDS